MTVQGEAATASLATYLSNMQGQMVSCSYVAGTARAFEGELLAFDDQALFMRRGDSGTLAIMLHAIQQIRPADDRAIEVSAEAYRAD